MKLYYAPGTCALACWIALEWSGLDYQIEKVDPRSEEFLRLNPLGMVPALDIGGARPMTQANAILHYIADLAGNNSLGPDVDMEACFEFNEIMSFLTGDFHPAFWPFFVPQRFTIKEDTDSQESVRISSYTRVDRVMTYLNDIIGESDHVYRNKRTVADAYAFVLARWSENFPKTWKDYPYLARFMQAMAADPAVLKVLLSHSN